MKWSGVLAVALLVVMTGCKREPGEQYREYFENDDAVILNDIIDVYDRYRQAAADSTYFDVSAALHGAEAYDDMDNSFIERDTAFALQLPQYASSRHPFLAGAEVFYNSCLLTFNVWSNHELWMRECAGFPLADKEDIVAAIRSISEDCIRDDDLRSAARTYKDSIIVMMNRPMNEWGDDESSDYLLMSFSGKIEAKSYRFFDDEEKFADSLDAMTEEIADATLPALERYRQAERDGRLGLMLHSLNGCDTFDEQCSLFLNWADSPESEPEDVWIIAVAGRLMNSGKYNPALGNIWGIWRCLFQYYYCGISRDSSIPNGLYNEMRKKCYLTCLKRIERHPDDIFAMNCAAVIGGRANINRFGEYPYGNQAAFEKYIYLQGRYQKSE